MPRLETRTERGGADHERDNDFRGNLAQATALEPAVVGAPVTIICTGIYWRNAWKYQARTYRHFGWDNGTLLANMLAVSAASGLPAKIVLGFVDADVNRVLDLDTRRASFRRTEYPIERAQTDIRAVGLNPEAAALPKGRVRRRAAELHAAGVKAQRAFRSFLRRLAGAITRHGYRRDADAAFWR